MEYGEYRTTVNDSGNWVVSIPVQQQGKIIRVMQEQPRRAPSDEIVITVSKAPEPLANPQVDPLYNDHYQITGRGEPGATIIVRIDGAGELRTTVDGAGNWTFKIEHNQTGYPMYTIYARQIENGKNDSGKISKQVYARLIQHTFGPGYGSAHGRRRVR